MFITILAQSEVFQLLLLSNQQLKMTKTSNKSYIYEDGTSFKSLNLTRVSSFALFMLTVLKHHSTKI